jgi:hypothetical protein
MTVVTLIAAVHRLTTLPGTIVRQTEVISATTQARAWTMCPCEWAVVICIGQKYWKLEDVVTIIELCKTAHP